MQFLQKSAVALSMSLGMSLGAISVVYAQDSTYPFDLYEVSPTVVASEQVLDGTVEAENRSTVSAQTSGRVLNVYYDVDDFVEKGAVLVRLKGTAQHAERDRARAGLEAAESRYIELRDEQLRMKELFDKKLIAKSKLDSVDASLKSAIAQVKSAKAAIRQAQEQVNNTVVKAPFSGIVVSREIEEGEIASPGRALMTGISLEDLRVIVNVPQRSIAAVRLANKARVILDDGRSVESDRLTFFPFADPATNSFKVRIHLAKSVAGVFPGMFAKVAFHTGESMRLLIPVAAIAYRSELTAVYVAKDDNKGVSLRQLRLGRHFGDHVEVLAGLNPGEMIALNPVSAGIYIKKQSSVAKGE